MALDWSHFDGLPGSAEWNFESVCRVAVRTAYGHLGHVRGTSQQPGIEFHLKLEADHTELGSVDRWWGWQCRLWQNARATTMRPGQKTKIEEAIKTTERVLPDLTDWVLWTRYPLTAGDQTWFDGLSSRFRLHRWTAVDHLDALLVGDALPVREAYFGGLILTEPDLERLLETCLEPIRGRWNPLVHSPTDAENALREMLLDPSAITRLDSHKTRLAALLAGIPAGTAAAAAEAVADTGSQEIHHVEALIEALSEGDFEAAQSISQVDPSARLAQRVHDLRKAGDPLSIISTNLASEIRRSRESRLRTIGHMQVGLVGVLGQAGYGKTELAAAIAGSTTGRPAGLYLQGTTLTRRGTLDDLVRGIALHGKSVTFKEALTALNAAGERARRRLPLVIDGLNECDDPREFKALLSRLQSEATRYPYVLTVVTTRDEFDEATIPDGVPCVQLSGFGISLKDALHKYAEYYKVRLDPETEVSHLLDHPLTMRLAFEVANAQRTDWVAASTLPAGLNELLEAYVTWAVKRMDALAPPHARLYPQDSLRLLDRFGRLLWKAGTRSVSVKKVRKQAKDRGPWAESRTLGLIHEGVLVDHPGHKEARLVSALYDRLGGHLIGSSVIAKRTPAEVKQWMRREPQRRAFGRGPDRHPLASDVLASLAYWLPTNSRVQLWTLAPKAFRDEALVAGASLPAHLVDKETVETLRRRFDKLAGMQRWRLLSALRVARHLQSHPLNAQFTDAALSPLGVADRDLVWTEYLRANEALVRQDLRMVVNRWRTGPEYSEQERLRALWAMWTLTSTLLDVRDLATLALRQFGTNYPDALFRLALDSLRINDPWVTERVMAAAYAVATSLDTDKDDVREVLKAFIEGLHQSLVGDPESPPTAPTSHWLVRYYARSTWIYAQRFVPDTLPGDAPEWTFAAGPERGAVPRDEARERFGGAIRSDFANYTLGGLFNGRRNYDETHEGWLRALARVYGTLAAMGWDKARFSEVERSLDGHGRQADRTIERYAKKYSWIGYFEVAGELEDAGLLDPDNSPFVVRTDPSFPEGLEPLPRPEPTWLFDLSTTMDNLQWLSDGDVQIPRDMLRGRDTIAPGEWVLVSAHLSQDVEDGRRTFAFAECFLVDPADKQRVLEELETVVHPDRHVFDPPTEYNVLANEFLWHPRVAVPIDEEGYYDRTLPAGDSNIPIETLAHEYGFEHGGRLAPDSTLPSLSKRLVEAEGLRRIPQRLNHRLDSGEPASLAFKAPAGLSGTLLYIRKDVLVRYASGRIPVLFAWGERELSMPLTSEPKEEIVEVYRRGSNVWRQVIDLSD